MRAHREPTSTTPAASAPCKGPAPLKKCQSAHYEPAFSNVSLSRLPRGDSTVSEMYVSGQSGIGRLIQALAASGHRVIGPRIRNQALVYDDIAGVEDLPKGWTDIQEPGRYRLERRGDEKLFGYVVGPASWKQYLNPPEAVLWSGTIGKDGFESDPAPEPPKYAFFGVRPCEIAAIGILDNVYTTSNGVPAVGGYAAVRSSAFIVAVNCSEPGGNCFCSIDGNGPCCYERLRHRDHRDRPRRQHALPARERQRCRGGACSAASKGSSLPPRRRSKRVQAMMATRCRQHGQEPRHRGPSRTC